MMRTVAPWFLLSSLTIAAGLAACGEAEVIFNGTGGASTSKSASHGTGGGDGHGGGIFTTTSGPGAGGMAMQGLDVQPSAPQMIAVAIGQQSPTIDYVATYNGSPASAGWAIDRGDIGT